MFVVMQSKGFSGLAEYVIISPEDGFESQEKAKLWCDEEDLVDVAIFEFKGFV